MFEAPSHPWLSLHPPPRESLCVSPVLDSLFPVPPLPLSELPPLFVTSASFTSKSMSWMEANIFRPFMFEIVFPLTRSLARKRILDYKLIPFTILKALLCCHLGPSVAVRSDSCSSNS